MKGYISIKGYLRRWAIFFKVLRSDFIYVYRETSPFGLPILLKIINLFSPKKIIYDFDDAIWLEDPIEKGTLLAKLKYKKKVGQLCKISWKVTVGNNFLADYARKFNQQVQIIPTVVDTEKRHFPLENNNSKQITLGWTGSHSTLKYLNDLEPVLKQVVHEFNCRILITANQKPELDIENLDFIAWSEENEIQVLNEMDIGIMPLPDEDWSKGKCGFKLIQYGAVGLPSLASKVGVNDKIVIDGETGFLCRTQQDWLQSLSLLINDASLRVSMGKKAREHIVKNYSVKSSIDAFLNLFDSA